MASDSTTGNADLSRVSQLKDADQLIEKVKQIKNGRHMAEREWKLNTAFYRGNQWVWVSKLGQIQSLPSADSGELPRWRVRLTSNQILPGVQAYIAMLTKTKPVITATPNSGDDSDIKAAQIAEQLFEQWWRDFNLKAKLQEALLWSALASAGYWKITWDPQAGKPISFLLGPDGQPITNPELADLYREQLNQEEQQAGLPAGTLLQMFTRTIYVGDIRVDVFGPHQIFLDPTATSFEDADWVICEHPMSPDEIKARYGVDVQADSVVTDFETGVPAFSKTTTSSPNKTVKKVYIGYFKPQPSLPKGRYVVFMENESKILVDTPWPYKKLTELPLVKFAGPRVPGSTSDEALVTHARPYQKLINAILSKVVEHVYLTIRPQMMAPTGSLRTRLTNEPGAVLEYTPMAGTTGQVIEPQWREMPTIPPYVFQFLEEIQGRIDRLFNLQAISRGDVPPNVEAGVAIDLLQEAAVDSIAPVIQGMEESLAKAGNMMALLAQEFYTEPRTLQITGPGGSAKVRKFLNADIQGGFNFHAEAGSGLPRTRAGRQARIESFISMGVLRPDQAWKYLDIADLKGLGAAYAADDELAQREHEKVLRGQPINPIAAEQAVSAIMQGINPETGQPLQPGDQPAQLVHNAGLQPLPFENLQAHLDAHSLFMKSVEFEGLPPDVQQDLYTHFMQTRTMLFEIPQIPEPQAIRTTLQLKGTVDPATAAKALQRSGVPEANEQELRTPPLLTWESEDITKPQVDAAGNQPLDQAQQLQAMAQQEEQHQAKMVDTAHKAALTAAKLHKEQQDNSGLEQSRVEELHQQKLRHNEDMHAVRLAQAKKPKPQPRGK